MKKLIPAVLIGLMQFVCGDIHAQLTNDAYNAFIKVADQCIYFRPERFDTLYNIKLIEIHHADTAENDELAWIKISKDSVLVLTMEGYEYTTARENMTAAEPVKLDEHFAKQNAYRAMRSNTSRNFDRNYVIAFWLDKKGRSDLAKIILPQLDTFISRDFVIDDFGTRYYSAMLAWYSLVRDYPAAIKYGEILKRDVFKTYHYQMEALALMRQLKKQTKDFTTFTLPCKQKWACLKKELNRKEQILYMADRLRLINSIQPGQPGDVNYKDPQFPFPMSERGDLNYWEYNEDYCVVNPYTELLSMHLNRKEVDLLLPYLLDNSYIPTYTFFRDYEAERTLHKVSWVVTDLLSEISAGLNTPDLKKGSGNKTNK